MGDFYRNMKPGRDCPPDDMLLDYVHMDLSEEESRDVSQHIKRCERCRFEVMKLEADRDCWQQALSRDPDAVLTRALGNEGLEQVRREIQRHDDAASMNSIGMPGSVQRRKDGFIELNQDTLDRIAAAAAAEVLDNVDLHIANWLKTREKQSRFGSDTGLAQASGLGVDILPFIADAVIRAWQWCFDNPRDFAVEGSNSELVAYVSSVLLESKGLTRLSDEEIEVLVGVIAREVADAITRKWDSAADE